MIGKVLLYLPGLAKRYGINHFVKNGAVAQLGERLPCTEEVRGSNPLSSTRALASKCSQKFTRELLQRFIASRAQGISRKTQENYHYTLDRFVGYPLTGEGINTYLANLTCRNGKLKFYSCLKALCNWLHRNGHIAQNPIALVPPPRTQKKLLPAISREQLEAIIGSCHCKRDKAIVSLLWYSGMRISEAMNVKAGDFDWNEGTVIVLGKGNRFRKALSGNGVVRQWFSEHDTFEVSKAGAQVMLKRLAKETGIHCNPHSFRRGFAVHQVKSGLSTRVVQALGGWENIAMVERYSKSLVFDEALNLYHQINGLNRPTTA